MALQLDTAEQNNLEVVHTAELDRTGEGCAVKDNYYLLQTNIHN